MARKSTRAESREGEAKQAAQDVRDAAAEALTAINAAYWFIENVAEDDPNRTNRHWALRRVLDGAQRSLALSGVMPSNDDAWRLVIADDQPTGTDALKRILHAHGVPETKSARIIASVTARGIIASN